MTHDLKDDSALPAHDAVLLNALIDLNDAAHKAIRAGRDTTRHPMLNREKLRTIARLSDEILTQPDANQ